MKLKKDTMLNNEERVSEREDREERISEMLDKISETTSPLTDRDLMTYCKYFHLKPEDLEGKKILDIGSGKQERFSKEASLYNAAVVSLNPALQEKGVREDVKADILNKDTLLEWRKKSVGGIAQELPFKDKSFDILTSLYAVPYYIDSHKGKLGAIKEMVRVLKEGGTIYIGPQVIENEQNITESILGKEVTNWLINLSYSIDEIEDGGLIIKKINKSE